jgi:DNA-binding transcriptional regulator WhiA
LAGTKECPFRAGTETRESFAKALKKELEWVRSNAKGQQKKNKARIVLKELERIPAT